MMRKNLAWLLAILLTLTAVIYQRLTGPTNPLRSSFSLGSIEVKAKFPRSLETLVELNKLSTEDNFSPFKVKLSEEVEGIRLSYLYRRYPSDDSLTVIESNWRDGYYWAQFPSQPPAGKVIYYPVISYRGEEIVLEEESGVILRFKAPVSPYTLIPHIILMFAAMFFANLTGFLALFNLPKVMRYGILTLITFIAGGLIFGPFVQKAAFGAYWTGWPFGNDLTDTKTIFALICWVIALWFSRERIRRGLIIAAAIITLLIYLIPHSTAGSHFDYEAGVVLTGKNP